MTAVEYDIEATIPTEALNMRLHALNGAQDAMDALQVQLCYLMDLTACCRKFDTPLPINRRALRRMIATVRRMSGDVREEQVHE